MKKAVIQDKTHMGPSHGICSVAPRTQIIQPALNARKFTTTAADPDLVIEPTYRDGSRFLSAGASEFVDYAGNLLQSQLRSNKNSSATF